MGSKANVISLNRPLHTTKHIYNIYLQNNIGTYIWNCHCLIIVITVNPQNIHIPREFTILCIMYTNSYYDTYMYIIYIVYIVVYTVYKGRILLVKQDINKIILNINCYNIHLYNIIYGERQFLVQKTFAAYTHTHTVYNQKYNLPLGFWYGRHKSDEILLCV